MQPRECENPLPQRRHRKMLKDGSSEVWPQEAEEIFLDGLREYWASPWANYTSGRSRWRNQYLVEYLKKNGIDRTKKQVASHIQVLRNMWKGHPEFTLVAGPEEPSESSSTSDRRSPSRRSSHLSRSPPRRRHSASRSSPPSTPPSHDSEASDGATSTGHPPTDLVLPSHALAQLPAVKTEHMHSPHVSFYESSGLPSVPELPGEQPSSIVVNCVASLCLWAEGMEPLHIDVDALPFSDASVMPSSPVPSVPSRVSSGGIVRTSLRVKLQMPIEGMGAPSTAIGFNGAIAFASPIAPSAEVMTRVHVEDNCVSREVQPLIPIREQPAANSSGISMQERYVAMLPSSWLSRCRWLDTGEKRSIVTQTVVVDAEPLFVVIYDLHRVRVPSPTAELVFCMKHVDNTPPQPPALLPLPIAPPNVGRYGGNAANAYLYSTAASLSSHSQPVLLHSFSPPAQHHGPSSTRSSPGNTIPISPVNAGSHSDSVPSSGESTSSQTTPTHTNFSSLGQFSSAHAHPSGMAPSTSDSALRCCSGYGQNGSNVSTGPGMPSHNHPMGATIGLENDVWGSNNFILRASFSPSVFTDVT